MKKVIAFFVIAALVAACGSEGPHEVKTKDIEGTIEAEPNGESNFNSNYNGFKSEGKKLKFDDKGEIMIFLSDADFETIKGKYLNTSLVEDYKVVDEGENYVHYSIKDEPMGGGDPVVGYKFIVVKPYADGKVVCLEGEDDRMPIVDKAVSQELLDIALTFEKK